MMLAGFLVLVLGTPIPVDAQQHKVLSVHAMRRDASATIAADQTIHRVLQQALAENLDYYSEYLDVTRFTDQAYLAALRDFLRHKYVNQRFDVVLATSDAALAYVKDVRDELFPGAAVVFAAEAGTEAPARSTGVTFTLNLSRTLGLVAALQPGARQVVVVSGSSPSDAFYESLARRQFQAYEGRFEITYLSGLAMPDLLARVGRLPSDAVLYPVSLYEDGNGERWVALEAATRVIAASNVPAYGWAATELDRGVVGGALLDLERLYGEVAKLALRVVRGEPVEQLPVTTIDPYVSAVDWRQLRRWRISESLVPAGTEIRFRQQSLWDQYKAPVTAAVTLLVLQTVLIAGLLVQSRQRRRAEAHNRDLAGRLITAQEGERTRIARELHDDVGQRVASLSMEIGLVKRRLADAPPDLREAVQSLQLETIELSRELRELSHELHPGMLEHLGLVEALKTRCDEIRAESGVVVTLEAGPDLGTIPPEAALCLYRVAQEALRNVVKHAKAETARVSLLRDNGRLAMRVADDGVGFDSRSPRRSRGLGLISLDERVRILNGTFGIDSSPSRGATVSVSLPVKVKS
jgi:signal transduction histidine kinase